MDENNNGLISYHEMLKGFDELEEFKKLMEIMDLKRDDMATVFRVLDTESTEEVPYLEFCQHLGSFFKRDPVLRTGKTTSHTHSQCIFHINIIKFYINMLILYGCLRKWMSFELSALR